MDAEEILKALAASNPEIAKAIEALNTPQKKKRGRPKKVKEPEPIIVVDNDDAEKGIFRPNKSRSRLITDPTTGETKTLTRAEEVDLSKIKSGVNDFTESEAEKDSYYAERPKEKLMYNKKPVERNRNNSLVKKTCEECKKRVEIPSICASASYFRCDDCLLKKNKNNE